jgi:hypothetical protein
MLFFFCIDQCENFGAPQFGSRSFLGRLLGPWDGRLPSASVDARRLMDICTRRLLATMSLASVSLLRQTTAATEAPHKDGLVHSSSYDDTGVHE